MSFILLDEHLRACSQDSSNKTYLAIFEYFRNMKEILFKEESAKIVGAIFEVHKRLGVGLLEKVYQEALAIELKHRNIPFEREKRFDVFYRDQKLDAQYIADFVCYDKIIVELKAVSELTDVHKAQVRNYLAITNYELGILCNFNELYMEPVRVLNSNLM